jgi:hypothetical protein
VTRLDQFKLETRRAFRALEDRIAKLEAGKEGGRGHKKNLDLNSGSSLREKEAVRETQRLWQEYQAVAAEIYEPRSERGSKSRFAERHHLSEREFRRAFSLTDKRGLGAMPRERYNNVIREVTETLRKTLNESPGTRRESPSMRLKPAV